MDPTAIVKIKVPGQSGLEFTSVLGGPQVNILIFHAAPESFDKYVVDPAALPIHTDANPGGVEHIGPRFAGELRALIGVDDLGRAVPGDCFVQRINAEVRRHRVRDPKGQESATRPSPASP